MAENELIQVDLDEDEWDVLRCGLRDRISGFRHRRHVGGQGEEVYLWAKFHGGLNRSWRHGLQQVTNPWASRWLIPRGPVSVSDRRRLVIV